MLKKEIVVNVGKNEDKRKTEIKNIYNNNNIITNEKKNKDVNNKIK